MTKHIHASRSKKTSAKQTRTHHKPATTRTVGHAHIGTRWAIVIIGCWVAIGLITGLALLHFTRRASQQAVTITVLKTTYDARGQDPFLPGTNYKFVLIDTKVSNTTDRTFNLAPVVQSYITDAAGVHYYMAPAIVAHPLAAGRLASKVFTQGTLSYTVPRNATHLTFHFNADSPQHVRFQQELPEDISR